MHRSTRTVLATILAIGLLLSLIAETWLIPFALAQTAAVFPEVAPTVVPAIAWEVVGFACWQLIVVLLLYRLLGKAPQQDAGVRRRITVGIVIAAGVFVLMSIVAVVVLSRADFATPVVMFALIGSAVLAALVCAGAAWRLGATAQVRHQPSTS
ncbi:hypothetical protein AAEP80_02810 [Curtobacterium sp. L3-7]|uniref:hypothetical protein n=1 Tax=Curtobacterium sp. L3-7 TaxID=3138787 RepID=UPI003B523884